MSTRITAIVNRYQGKMSLAVDGHVLNSLESDFYHEIRSFHPLEKSELAEVENLKATAAKRRQELSLQS